jgi:hypothetical protein
MKDIRRQLFAISTPFWEMVEGRWRDWGARLLAVLAELFETLLVIDAACEFPLTYN